MITLNKWTIVDLTKRVLVAPRYGGDDIITSEVQLLDMDNGYAVTSNRIYKLGEPDDVWSGSEDFNTKVEGLIR